MRKIFAIIIGCLLFLTIIIILLPHLINGNDEINVDVDEDKLITCEFNLNEMENKLTSCLSKIAKRNFNITINNVTLSDTTKTVKINYDKANDTLELYFDDELLFTDKNIDTKRIQNIKVFNNELFILAYYTKSDIKYDTGNLIALDSVGDLAFQLKEDESYYSISNINTNENKISFSKYYFSDFNEILKENYETTYLGEEGFSDYNIIDSEILK